MNECEQFRGRLRDLCEGRGRDGRGNPPQYAVDLFRAQQGLPPIAGTRDRLSTEIMQSARSTQSGPGQKLRELLAQLAIAYREDCGCEPFARQMDDWSIAGCLEHFDEIVHHLRENARKYSFWEHLQSAVKAAASGLAYQLNPLDPFPGLVREAIRRAEIESIEAEQI